jgi:tyrosine-protein kinase Etk/Wzc
VQTPAVQDPLIDRFNLLKVFDVDARQTARKILTDRVLLSDVDAKSGIIWVTVEDTDPQRAADMADQAVEELRKVLETISTADETKRRIFYEGQLKRVHEDLSKSETRLQSFEENSGVLKIDDQATAALQGIAALQAQIAAKEVQLKVMKTYATTYNPDLKKTEEELRALKVEAARLEAKEENYTPEAIIPTGHLPVLGTEYLRILRDFKYNEALNELITKQYQASIVEEARESASVQVINKAPKPEKRTKPNPFLIVPIAAIGGFIIFGSVAFLIEYVEKVTVNPENEERIQEVKRYLSRR